MNQREVFLKHVAQTSSSPVALEIVKAAGCVLYDVDGKEYLDLVGGISVANTGHRHPKVIAAIQQQLDAYLHIMVYGEFIESPQVQYSKLLADHLPQSLNCIYFTNSGAEAVEGAMKLAKRYTGRIKIAAFENSYHGSTQGALSIMGDEYWRNAFRPLLPGILHLRYGSFNDIDLIDEQCAIVVLETVQAEAGINAPSVGWMKALRERCNETKTLLALDEIQTGFGRTGKLWGFEHFDIIPDILLLGKALGGGMPLGAFISDRKIMEALLEKPVLGHITTFGGHPVCCAAGMAAMNVLLEEQLIDTISEKVNLYKSLLVHEKIKAIRSFGLWLSVDFENEEEAKKIIDKCILRGVFTDWFLFSAKSMRISPPLIITSEQIRSACNIILAACDS